MITISMMKRFVIENPGFDNPEMREKIKELERDFKDGCLVGQAAIDVLGPAGAQSLFGKLGGDARLMDLSYLELVKSPIVYLPYDMGTIVIKIENKGDSATQSQPEDMVEVRDNGKHKLFVSQKVLDIFPDLIKEIP